MPLGPSVPSVISPASSKDCYACARNEPRVPRLVEDVGCACLRQSVAHVLLWHRPVESDSVLALWKGREIQAVRALGADWLQVRLRPGSPGGRRRGLGGRERGRRSPSPDRRAGGCCGGAGE